MSPPPPPPPPPPPDPHPPRIGAAGAAARGPSVLDLVRLSPQPVFPPGGEGLYRQIALLTELGEGDLLLDAGSGRGLTTTFLATHYGVEAHGLDPDPLLVAEAERRARESTAADRLHFQVSPLDDLPYQDGIFDIAIGEVALAVHADPARAVRELARVTRDRGWVVLVQLIWTGHLAEERREELAAHLGARPMLLVEWKQLLREAGVVDLHVEDWSDQSSPFRPAPSSSPFHDMARIFTLRQKLAILRRALRRWGWRGVRGAIVREQEIHQLLTRHRVLGLTLIRGTKWEAGK